MTYSSTLSNVAPIVKRASNEIYRTTRRDERFTVMTVEVELDFLGVKAFEKAIARAAANADGIVIDLLKCNMCDSASLAVMAKQKYILKDSLQFVVAGSGLVRRAFEVTGLSGSSPMHGTVSSALGTLRSVFKEPCLVR